MDEEQMNRVLMFAGMVCTILAGVSTIGLLIMTAYQPGWTVFFVTVLMAFATVLFGVGAAFYGAKVSDRNASAIFSKYEAGLLSWKQRRYLKAKRGEVVMQKALIEIEHEHDNITHDRMLEAADPERPPHVTQWSPEPVKWEHHELKAKPKPRNRRWDEDDE